MDGRPLPDLAIILAAGVGARLGTLGEGRPKGLLKIGGGPLIERSLHTLRDCGLEHVVLVTGYRADAYHHFLQARFPWVERIHNPDYATTGSMRSLATAAGFVTREALVVESDLLYEPRAIQALLSRPPGDCLLLSGPTAQGDEVYAYGIGDRLRLLTKALRDGEAPLGEFVGISRLTATTVRAMCHQYEPRCQYDDRLSELSATRDIRVLRIDGLRWAEVDDAAQYRRAEALALA